MLAGWHRIDKAEVAAGARLGRPRVKLTDWKALLDRVAPSVAEGPLFDASTALDSLRSLG